MPNVFRLAGATIWAHEEPSCPPETRLSTAPVPSAFQPVSAASNDGVVTMSFTGQDPTAKVWPAVAPAWGPAVVPSPKSKKYDATVPSASVEAAPLAVTASGPGPVAGVSASFATGGALASATTLTAAV